MFRKKRNSNKKPVLMERQELKGENIKAEKKISEQKNLIPNKTIIAFASTHQGAGSTHLSLALAYELSKKNKVALVEKKTISDLIAFDKIYKLNSGKLTSKRLDRLDVYFNNSERLIDILKENYDYIILDFGEIINYNEENIITEHKDMLEVYKADIKILVTQTREWQLKYLADFIKYDKELKEWVIVANLSSKKDFKELSKTLKNTQSKVLSTPYIEDVFKSSFMKEFLKSII